MRESQIDEGKNATTETTEQSRHEYKHAILKQEQMERTERKMKLYFLL